MDSLVWASPVYLSTYFFTHTAACAIGNCYEKIYEVSVYVQRSGGYKLVKNVCVEKEEGKGKPENNTLFVVDFSGFHKLKSGCYEVILQSGFLCLVKRILVIKH